MEKRGAEERVGKDRVGEGRREKVGGEEGEEGNTRPPKQQKEILVSGPVGMPSSIVNPPPRHTPDPLTRFCYI